ncbi:hypothetical protein BO83DRAFT_25589 [Aspergillus eucalypticola CBS 122712]|uniref:Uncharacterized protein n=1 Tax=Aspergillus eucalypticola (strain CBS 122712 / IBT 29274) TaxID=1448314 RepID=A0A317VIB4_ASPEC|nr:uncharacterized protein BO83DRAFT_25589 [Aspergillus eucalypticola CBS 122712]PWY74106.1 hypothetical protein BO83DRAFT_25589 [Aspergillus eucalypticola CBS 122712]
MLRRPYCWESKSATKSFSSGPRCCSVLWADGRPEAMSFLVLSTNIRCEVAWLDASACDTQCLVVDMLWVVSHSPSSWLTPDIVRQRTANIQLLLGGGGGGCCMNKRRIADRQRADIVADLLGPIYLPPAERAIPTILAPYKCLLSLLTTTWRKPHVLLFCCLDINLLFSFPL